MALQRVFVDTAFVQALLNKNDTYHEQARRLLPYIHQSHQVWITEAVLTEIANALSGSLRSSAVRFINSCYTTPNIVVQSVTTDLFHKGVTLYHQRDDKQWGLTDCISFVVMQEQGLYEAAASDKHFIQAGYTALLLNT